MRGTWKNKGNFDFPFFRSVTPRSQNVFFGRYTLGWGFWWKSGPCFFTKSVKFRFGELSISWICAESRDLGPEHGFRACSLKKDSKVREQIGFSYVWCSKVKKKQKQWKQNDSFWQGVPTAAPAEFITAEIKCWQVGQTRCWKTRVSAEIKNAEIKSSTVCRDNF